MECSLFLPLSLSPTHKNTRTHTQPRSGVESFAYASIMHVSLSLSLSLSRDSIRGDANGVESLSLSLTHTQTHTHTQPRPGVESFAYANMVDVSLVIPFAGMLMEWSLFVAQPGWIALQGIYMCDMSLGFMCVTCLVHVCDMPRSCV